MGQSVQQGCGHFFINKHRRPFDKAEIGGNDAAGPLIEFADQVEQPVGYPPLLPSLPLLFQGIDQFYVERNRTRCRWCWMACTAIAVARRVLPVPGPPTSTTFWASSRNWHRCNDFTRASSTVLCSKSKPVRSR